jgi:hypothetical protein
MGVFQLRTNSSDLISTLFRFSVISKSTVI